MSTIKLSRDPADDVFLETAVGGSADLVISGDKTDLLSQREIEGIPIISAFEAVVQLGL